nr:hypothetical protein [Olegusella massiliensis]
MQSGSRKSTRGRPVLAFHPRRFQPAGHAQDEQRDACDVPVGGWPCQGLPARAEHEADVGRGVERPMRQGTWPDAPRTRSQQAQE